MNVFLKARIKLGETQTGIAKLLNVSKQSISMYELERRIPHPIILKRYLAITKSKVVIKKIKTLISIDNCENIC